MDPVSILEQWLEPITGPLKDFRTQISDLADTHQSTLTSFNDLVNDLTNPATNDAFTGPAADTMQTAASDFFTIERPMSDLLTDTGPIEAIDASEAAVDGMMAAIFSAGGEVTDTGPLLTITEGVDAAAVVQGGFDLPNDGAAAGITAIEAAALLVIFLQLAGTLLFIWLTWKDALNGLVAQMNPPLPAKPAPVIPPSGSTSSTFTNLQRKTAQKLADEYGINIEDILALLEYNPNYTERELRAILDKYRRKQAQYPQAPQGALLLAIAMNLPDPVLAYLTHLNDNQTNSYLKGHPDDDTNTDVLAALLGQLTLDAKVQFTRLQAAARQGAGQLSADDKKDPAKKKQAIIDAVEATGVSWDSLPGDVQNTLLGRYGTNYQFGYGKSIEALVQQKFNSQYADIKTYYKRNYALEFNQPLPGVPDKKPDVQIDAPTLDVQITENGKKNVLDITSQKNMPDKKKYDLQIVQILIALGY